MKKVILILAIVFAGSLAVNAQGGGFQRRTVEERVASVHQKMDSAFKLDNTKLAQTDSIFSNYYRSTDKVRDEMMSGGQPDFQAMREKMQPYTDDRDKKLQGVLTEAQYKTWKDAIEPMLRPRRPGGGGGNR